MAENQEHPKPRAKPAPEKQAAPEAKPAVHGPVAITFNHPHQNDGGYEKKVQTAGNHVMAMAGQNNGGFELKVPDTRL